MLSEDTIQIVKATAPVVSLHAEAITRQFYTLMFAGNPETLAYFNPAHQHVGEQQRALAGAICAYAANIDNLAVLQPAVELIAQKHCSLGVRPEHYPIVGKHLLVAIKDVLGDGASTDVLDAWSKAYAFLAEVFTGREAQIYQAQITVPGGWNGYRRFIVDRKCAENEIITSFYLRPADGGPLAPFKSGQYLTVKIAPAVLPTPPRNYSLSDRPGLAHYRISVKRESSATANAPTGLVSNHLHDCVTQRDVLEIGPPCGEFTLEPKLLGDRPLVLISGGIGITPLMSMLKNMAHHQVTTPVYFIHAARNSRHHVFAEEVQRLAAECSNIQTHFRYDAPLVDDVLNRRCDSTGFIDEQLLLTLLPTMDAEFYVCGPKPFMAKLLQCLERCEVADSQIHYEFFGPKLDLSLGKAPHRNAQSTGRLAMEIVNPA